MSSLAERLRVRSEKRPSYNVDGSDDEDEVLTYQRRRRRTKNDKKQDNTMRDDSLYTRSEKKHSDTAEESDDEDEVPIGQRRRMTKQEPEKIMRDDPSLTMSSMGERLRVRPEKRRSYNFDDSDDEDEAFIVQRRRAHVEKHPKKIMRDDTTSTASSFVERLRVGSDKRPSYDVDESDDEDDVPLAQRRGHQKEEKPPEKILLEDVNLSTGTMTEGLCAKSEERSSYNDTDKSDDEDEVPIGHIRDRLKGDKPLETITQNDPSKASSLGERRCVRTAKRPLYTEDDPDDEDEFSGGPRRGRPKKDKPPEKIMRDDTDSAKHLETR